MNRTPYRLTAGPSFPRLDRSVPETEPPTAAANTPVRPDDRTPPVSRPALNLVPLFLPSTAAHCPPLTDLPAAACRTGLFRARSSAGGAVRPIRPQPPPKLFDDVRLRP